MPDNKKDQFDLGSDFDFAAIAEFESDDKATQSSNTDDTTQSFEDFGASNSDSGFSSFDTGAEFEDSTPTVDFSSDEFTPTEDFSDGADFDFGGPPSPQSVELDSLSGNPDDEFSDFDAGSGFADDEIPVDPYAEDDTGHDNSASPGEHIDPFGDEDEHVIGSDEAVAEAASKNTGKPGIKQYAGIAAAVAVFGYLGYSHVLPLFVSTNEGPVVSETHSEIPSGSLPIGLPPTSQPSDQLAGLPQPLPLEVPVAAPVDGSAQIALPSIDLVGTTPVTVDTNQPTDIAPTVTPPLDTAIKLDPLDEMVGGSDRGGLASMKSDTPEPAPVNDTSTIASADIAKLASRLDDVVKRIETIEQKVASFGASFGGTGEVKTPLAADKPSILPAVADAGVSAPLKPPIIENVVLRGVSRDIAWIATSKGVVEVKVGDTIENAGVVESFQNYRGRWIAVTDKGIILPR
jgi:hypothetical protein